MSKNQFAVVKKNGIHIVVPCVIIARGTERHTTIVSIDGTKMQLSNGCISELIGGAEYWADYYNNCGYNDPRVTEI